MLSMTGYASLIKENDDFALQVDIKSVNSKYSDLRLNASFCDNNFLEVLRKTILERVYRGQLTVDLNLKFDTKRYAQYALDTNQIQHYIEDYEEAYGKVKPSFSNMKHFLKLEHIVKQNDFVFDAEKDGEFVKKALVEALDQFYASRAEEGARLQTDLKEKVAQLLETRAAIEQRVPELDRVYRERLENRMQEFIGHLDELDETRILNEVAIQATKTTVDEELVRLASHLEKLSALLESDAAVGKKIDFYMQEINREYNTIASKISDVDVAEKIVESKVIVDQIREQAQNII